jgi:hypothetical protein
MLFSCTSLHATAVAPLADRGSPASRRRLYICCCDSSIGTRLLPAGRLYIVCCRCVDSIVAPSSAWGDCKCYLVKIRPSRLGGRGRAGAEGTVGNPICLTLLLQSYMHSFIHPAPPACLAAEPPARSRLLSEGGQPNVAMQGELRAVRPAQSEPWSLVTTTRATGMLTTHGITASRGHAACISPPSLSNPFFPCFVVVTIPTATLSQLCVRMR